MFLTGNANECFETQRHWGYPVGMADFKTVPSIGGRIAAIRKARGFKSTKDLADAVPNDSVTESILQNIEAGRKNDLAVSQLINIAWALKISPLFLLAPLGSPDGKLDLPNLSDEVNALTVAQFDAWVASLGDGVYIPTRLDERYERSELAALRELHELRRELERFVVMQRLTLADNSQGPDAEFIIDSNQTRIDVTASRIRELENYLAPGGWEITKTEQPLRDLGTADTRVQSA